MGSGGVPAPEGFAACPRPCKRCMRVRCVSVVGRRKLALTVSEGGSMLVVAHGLLLGPEVIADVDC